MERSLTANASDCGASPALPGPPALLCPLRVQYLAVLTWSFTLFNSLRVVAYLPTLWAIQSSGDTSQHSLITWLTWLGANVTMGAWLYEQSGQRITRAVLVNGCNALMCAAICAVIGHARWGS